MYCVYCVVFLKNFLEFSSKANWVYRFWFGNYFNYALKLSIIFLSFQMFTLCFLIFILIHFSLLPQGLNLSFLLLHKPLHIPRPKNFFTGLGIKRCYSLTYIFHRLTGSLIFFIWFGFILPTGQHSSGDIPLLISLLYTHLLSQCLLNAYYNT